MIGRKVDIPMMDTCWLYLTVVLGRPPSFKPPLPLRLKVEVLLPKVDRQNCANSSGWSRETFCWMFSLVVLLVWAVGASKVTAEVSLPGRHNEVLKPYWVACLSELVVST